MVETPEGKRRSGEARARDEATGMPPWAVEVLDVQTSFGPRSTVTVKVTARLDQQVPPSVNAGSSARPEGAEALARITSHTFRKTAATILDEAAASARLVAEQLGHSRIWMTQDFAALEAASRDAVAEGENRGKPVGKDEGQDA